MPDDRTEALSQSTPDTIVETAATIDTVEAPVLSARDSAGVIISEYDRARAWEPSGWRLQDQPVWELGRQGSPEFEFFQLGGVAALSDGRVVVVDGASKQVRIFNNDATLLRTLGRDGDGPGEFRVPVLVPPVMHDTLLLFDSRHRRFTWLSLPGGLSESVSLSESIGQPVGRAGARRLVVVRRPALSFFPRRTADELVDNTTRIELYDLNDPAATRIVYQEHAHALFLADETGGQWLLVPLQHSPAVAATLDGFWLSVAASSQVRRYDADGRLQRIIRITDVAPLSRSQWDDLLLSEADRVTESPEARQRVLQAYRLARAPTHWPLFEHVLVDVTGNVWLRTYSAEPARMATWLVFGSDGRSIGSIEIPGDVQVRYVGTDYILGVTASDEGVELVRKYRILKPTSSPMLEAQSRQDSAAVARTVSRLHYPPRGGARISMERIEVHATLRGGQWVVASISRLLIA